MMAQWLLDEQAEYWFVANCICVTERIKSGKRVVSILDCAFCSASALTANDHYISLA